MMIDDAPNPDVGDPTARVQALLDIAERRDPLRRDVRDVAGPEEGLAAEEDVVVVFVPAHACAGAEGRGDAGFGPQRSERELEGARQVDGAVGIGEAVGLLGGEGESAVVGDGHVAAHGLAVQPFADRTDVGAGAVGELVGGERAVSEGAVEAEPVPDDDAACRGRRAEVGDEPFEEGVQGVGVDAHRGRLTPGPCRRRPSGRAACGPSSPCRRRSGGR
jgi:hypothetical protein